MDSSSWIQTLLVVVLLVAVLRRSEPKVTGWNSARTSANKARFYPDRADLEAFGSDVDGYSSPALPSPTRHGDVAKKEDGDGWARSEAAVARFVSQKFWCLFCCTVERMVQIAKLQRTEEATCIFISSASTIKRCVNPSGDRASSAPILPCSSLRGGVEDKGMGVGW